MRAIGTVTVCVGLVVGFAVATADDFTVKPEEVSIQERTLGIEIAYLEWRNYTLELIAWEDTDNGSAFLRSGGPDGSILLDISRISEANKLDINVLPAELKSYAQQSVSMAEAALAKRGAVKPPFRSMLEDLSRFRFHASGDTSPYSLHLSWFSRYLGNEKIYRVGYSSSHGRMVVEVSPSVLFAYLENRAPAFKARLTKESGTLVAEAADLDGGMPEERVLIDVSRRLVKEMEGLTKSDYANAPHELVSAVVLAAGALAGLEQFDEYSVLDRCSVNGESEYQGTP